MARDLLFCAHKRSGAFPPNMPAGLRARVSRLCGFAKPLSRPLIFSPQLGPRLFVIKGEAVYQPFPLVPNPDGAVAYKA
jgi:hypothetical protein